MITEARYVQKCPCEEDDQDQVITIFDEDESIQITAGARSFAPPNPNMILTVSDSASTDASHLGKDTFVLYDVTYVIDDEYHNQPKIHLSSQQIKRTLLQGSVINHHNKET